MGNHTETVQLEYDPVRITYQELLEIFFASHNSTRRSFRRQYASIIFYHDEAQKLLAEDTISRIEETGKKIATELLPYTGFTRAEDYHQKYYLRNQADLEKHFETIYPDSVRFTDSTAAARVNGYLGGYGSREQFEREAPGLGLNETQIRALKKLIWKWRK
jgi:hypothetical protein